MSYFTGTSSGGAIIGARPDQEVLAIEFHAKATNNAEATVGDSAVTLGNGMGLEPDDRHSPNFVGEDGVKRTVMLSKFYTAVSGSDKVDWAVHAEP